MSRVNNLKIQRLAKKNNVQAKNLVYMGIWETPADINYYLVLYNINLPDHPSHGSTVAYQEVKNG